MSYDGNKRHHLLTIQAIIARMGVNSFWLKGVERHANQCAFCVVC